ncbi:helix-turn-helix domain-containing protein [Arsenicicoccus piscis]|uniref:helix-turn-helix domain-containing protein n=1 Tax=Arsenicicoccus piscis TaxID=673954 RepID=UPI001F4C64DC|nr:helix-turn-helix domain-containing protein [Arsenicicoccus piscis]MCH8627575.1 helix-turn-helix domain-containing protein [Arsenicicoccus piscis]
MSVAAVGGPLLASSMRRQILEVLLDRGTPLSAAEVGDLVDLHVTTARFHLDTLVAAGVVEASREDRHRVGRPRKLYGVVPQAVLGQAGRRPRAAHALDDLPGRVWRHRAALDPRTKVTRLNAFDRTDEPDSTDPPDRTDRTVPSAPHEEHP